MKIISVSDTHTYHDQLKIPKCDILIHCGDISYKGKIEEINPFLSWFNQQPAKYKIFIAGNHDFLFQKMRVPIPQGLIYLEDNTIEIEGLKIYGSPWTPYFYDWAFNGTDNFENEESGPNLYKLWRQIPKDIDLLITHGPPLGILDKNLEGSHCGSVVLADIMPDFKKLKAHFFGHIHEGYGKVKLNEVSVVNASSCNRQYKCINKPIMIKV